MVIFLSAQFVKSGVKETVLGKMPFRWFLHVRFFVDPAFYQNDGVIQGCGFFAWSPVLGGSDAPTLHRLGD